MLYINDIDLLFYEPRLALYAGDVMQTLMSGTGALTQSQFQIDTGSLVASRIQAGMILSVSGPYTGSYPIIEVGTATQMTISRISDGLVLSPPEAVAVGTGISVPYQVQTFWAQRWIACRQIDALIAVQDATILNPDSLRHPAALWALELIYQAMVGDDDTDRRWAARAALYQQQRREALRQVQLQLEVDGTIRTRGLNQLAMVHR